MAKYAVIDIDTEIEYAPGDDLVGIVDAPDADTAILAVLGRDLYRADPAGFAEYIRPNYAAVTIDEMVAWIEDCDQDVTDRSPTEIANAVAHNYDGGLRQFVADGVPA